jgi:hypothetical protein
MPSDSKGTQVTKAERLLLVAQQITEETPEFFIALGQGKGNIRSNLFMAELRKRARSIFGTDYSECKLCGDTNLAIDFYFPDEETAVEIAGMLGAPNSEYEKDIFKCLLAKDGGKKISKLVFIAKPGSAKVHNQPGRRAIADFVRQKYGIEVSLEELVNPFLA